MPFLKKENKKVHEKYLKFSKELIEYDNFVNTYIRNNNFIVDNKIIINKIKGESDFIKRKALELLIKKKQKKQSLLKLHLIRLVFVPSMTGEKKGVFIM